MGEGPLMRLEHVPRRFGGTVAVDDVTASFDPGMIYGLISPNGSGKTTLINLSADSRGASKLLFSGDSRSTAGLAALRTIV